MSQLGLSKSVVSSFARAGIEGEDIANCKDSGFFAQWIPVVPALKAHRCFCKLSDYLSKRTKTRVTAAIYATGGAVGSTPVALASAHPPAPNPHKHKAAAAAAAAVATGGGSSSAAAAVVSPKPPAIKTQRVFS